MAKKVDELATSLLHAMSPDDPREGLYAGAMFALVLVDEGLLPGRQERRGGLARC